MQGDAVLRARGLTKRFGSLTAVDHLDIELHRGEVLGLLGPNGAGKSTTIGMTLGLVAPSDGAVEILGRDVWRDRATALRDVGAIIENPAFYPYLTGRDNLRALAMAAGGVPAARIEELLRRVGLADRAASATKTYSLGMKQRLGIASTLLLDPALVILDEPANGLDPAGQREIRALIRELAGEGRGVLLASHLLHEVEQVCDRVVVIHRGRLIKAGTVEELLRSERSFEVQVEELERAADLVRPVPGVVAVELDGDRLRVTAGPESGSAIARALAAGGLYPAALIPRRGSLEDVFIQLTGEEGADAPAAA